MDENSSPSSTDKEITIWYFITALCIGGAEQTLVDLVNNLDTDRYNVTVWTIFETNPLAEDLRSDVIVRSLTSSGRIEHGYVVGVTDPLAVVRVPVRFCYAARVEEPDIIQSFLLFDNVIARVAGLFSPATIITGVRSVPNERSWARVLLDRLTIRFSDAIVSNSATGADLAVKLGAPEERVTVIHNGRNIDQFKTANPSKVRNELDIEDNSMVIGTVGRLLERKGHFELITAWSHVQNRFPDAYLLFVGDGQDRRELKTHAKQQNCLETIKFLGQRRDVPSLLAMMDIFAFPSHYEGFPGAVLEAMAAGLPIIATPVDGTSELIQNYRTGLFVSVKAPDELAWALIRVMEHSPLRSSLGNAAQQQAAEKFSIDVMVNEFETLYEHL